MKKTVFVPENRFSVHPHMNACSKLSGVQPKLSRNKDKQKIN
jgi:hypothetical protein